MSPKQTDAKEFSVSSESWQGAAAPDGAANPRHALAKGLHVVSTPIGNLGDITLRALETLHGADIVVCEDTRVTGRLLKRFNIATPQMSYHDHNAARVRPRLIERLKQGDIVALVSDAGTPLISDPGYRLVRAAREEGIPVTVAPGASAVLAALAVAGLPTDRFLFAGFLPAKKAQRRKTLGEFAALRASLVFYEAPSRLAAVLADMEAVFGPREAAVARELTKMYEEVRHGTLGELAAHYAELDPPKGELVIVVAPPDADARPDAEALDKALRKALETMSVRDAAAAVAAETGLARRDVYARALAIGRETE